MAEQLLVVAFLVGLGMVLAAGAVALEVLGRILRRAGVPRWVLPMLLLTVMVVVAAVQTAGITAGRWWST